MRSSRDEHVRDSNFESLVADARSKSEHKFQDVLTKLQDITRRTSVGNLGQLEELKNDLYSSGVLAYCADALKFNHANTKGGYAAAAQMAELISMCCVGFQPERNRHVFYDEFLKTAAANLLYLADRLMNRALRDKGQTEMIRLFRKVFDSIGWLLKTHHHLIPHVFQCKHYESVQMCEDEDIATVALLMWQDVLRTNSAVVSEMADDALHSITDDVVCKMALSSNPVIGSVCVKILLLILEHRTSILPSILRRYKGLDDMVRRDWRGKGFDAALGQLISLLQSGSSKDRRPRENPTTQRTTEERAKAACVIQAAWRAHQTRRRVRKLPRAVSLLQRSFRERRRRQQESAHRKQVEEELRYQVRLRRQRAIRQFRQHQLQLLEMLPAAQVACFLGEVEKRAALRIQSAWRGHRERRSLHQRRHALKQHKAAVTLQRAVLRFLKWRRAQHNVPAPWGGPRGLTDARRTELRKQVDEYVAFHPSAVVSAEGSVELHQHAQSLLQHHLLTRASVRVEEQHRQALLAQINTDLELLLNAPSLKATTAQDSQLFLSRSAPVAARAKQSHNATLQRARLPWWRILGDEGDDPEALPNKDHDMEFQTLYLGGS